MVLKLELHQNHLESWDPDAAGLGWDDLCITEPSRMLLDSDKFPVAPLAQGPPFWAGRVASSGQRVEKKAGGRGHSDSGHGAGVSGTQRCTSMRETCGIRQEKAGDALPEHTAGGSVASCPP